LISLPPPLNAILFFLGPFMMTAKNPEIINRVVLWIAYLPILIISFALFAGYSFALIPLTYVKMFFHKMIMIFIYSKSHRVSRADKFMLWIFFGIFGPFKLFRNAIVDCIAYLQHCSLQDLKKTKVQIRDKPLSKESLSIMAEYFRKRSERMVPFR